MKKRQLNIPTIGDVFTLAADWTFTLIAEHRNSAMIDYLKETGVIAQDAQMWEPALCRAAIPATRRQLRDGARAISGPYHWDRRYAESDYEDVVYNDSCLKARGHDDACSADYRDSPRQTPARYGCTLPKGTRLRVDRIYIRKGKKEYDSLTFWALDLSKKRVRFFARLADVNKAIVTDGDATPKRVAKLAPGPIRAIHLLD